MPRADPHRSAAVVLAALLGAAVLCAGQGWAQGSKPGAAAVPAAAKPGPFAFARAISIGKPAKTAQISVAQDAEGTWLALDKTRTAMPLRAPERADVQNLSLAGNSVAIVRVSGAGQEAAAIVARDAAGRARVVWSGALDRRGDLGERHGYVIEASDRTGDGAPDLVLSEVDDRVRRCGEERTLFASRVLEPSTLTFKRLGTAAATATPVAPAPAAGAPAASPTASTPSASTVDAVAQSPGPTKAPVLSALRSSAVSSQRDGAIDAYRTQALTDGDLATRWTTAEADGRGELATFQWHGAGRPIAALAFVPLPTGETPAPLSVPTTIEVVDDRGSRLHVRLPAQPAAGARYWVKPSQPIDTKCIAFVLETTAPRSGSKAGPAVLAEIEAYTDLDFGGGAETLIAELVAGGERGGNATQLLSTLGPSVLPLLAAAWPKLDPAARQRALRVLAPHVERVEGARTLATAALDDADPEVAKAALETLIGAGSTARQGLLPRVAEVSARGDELALALARAAPAQSIPALLEALGRPGGADRKSVRRALLVAAQHGGTEALDAVRAFVARQDVGVATKAALALALSRAAKGEGAHVLATEVAAAAAPFALEFVDRYRLVEAARALPPGEPLDAWLAQLAAQEERWMLRSLAVTALAERASPNARSAASAALKDEYPRVRVAAAGALAAQRAAFDELALHAQRDQWPMVRGAALEALAEQPGAVPVLRAALADNAHRVRAAAVHGLARAGARDSWPAIKALLEDPEEWPEVLTEAVAFAGTLCIAEARKPLLARLRRGAEPDADAKDADLGVAALDVLRRLGGDAERSALALAASPAAPAAFRGAAEHPLPKEQRCPTSSAR